MLYQRTTIRSNYDYYTIKLCSLIIREFQRKRIPVLIQRRIVSSLLIKRLSIKVILRSVLLLANMKNGRNQMNDCKIKMIAEFLSPLTLFPVRAETPRCSNILTLKWRLVLPY